MKRFFVKIINSVFVSKYEQILDATTPEDAKRQAMEAYSRWVRNKTTEDTIVKLDDFVAEEI